MSNGSTEAVPLVEIIGATGAEDGEGDRVEVRTSGDVFVDGNDEVSLVVACQISQVMFSGDPSANKQKQSLVFEQRVGKVFKMQGSSSST